MTRFHLFINLIWSLTMVQPYLFGLFDADSCELNCKLMPKDTFSPYSNGCGTQNMRINFEKTGYREFESCCDQHDRCYATCDRSKKNCDHEFYTCLKSTCENITQYQSCLKQAELLKDLVVNFGCSSFTSAKKEACDCV